jgi:hypothetical protein
VGAILTKPHTNNGLSPLEDDDIVIVLIGEICTKRFEEQFQLI